MNKLPQTEMEQAADGYPRVGGECHMHALVLYSDVSAPGSYSSSLRFQFRQMLGFVIIIILFPGNVL